MLTPTFQMVGGERGVWLSDLKFTGFENNSDLWYDGQLAFNIQIRDTDGKIAKTVDGSNKDYTWTQHFDNGGWMDEEGGAEDPEKAPEYMLGSEWKWTKGVVQPHVEGSDLWLPAGTGLWLSSPAKSPDDPDAEYVLTFNGEVNLTECPVVFKQGKNPTGNMFPLGIRLTSLIPTGFENNEDLWYDGQLTFNIQILDYVGKIAKTAADGSNMDYTYTQHFDNAGWMDEEGGAEDPEKAPAYMLGAEWKWTKGVIVAGSENDPVFNPSEGLWISAPAKSANDPQAVYSITFRAPTVEK